MVVKIMKNVKTVKNANTVNTAKNANTVNTAKNATANAQSASATASAVSTTASTTASAVSTTASAVSTTASTSAFATTANYTVQTTAQLLAIQTAIIAKFPQAQNDQTFDCFGTSVQHNTTCKARFANFLNKRIKVLVKNAHTQINLFNTVNNTRVTKLQACAIMLQHNAFATTAQQNAIIKYVVNNCAQHLQALSITQAQIATAIA